MSQFFERNNGAVKLTPKQANIYLWGWQPDARFRDAVCGRRFGKTFWQYWRLVGMGDRHHIG